MTDEALTELNRKIAVMEASKTQKIESRNTHRSSLGPTCWFPSPDPDWEWDRCDYRVKPVEPARLYRSALGGIYCTPTGEVAAEFIELTPEVKSKLGL